MTSQPAPSDDAISVPAFAHRVALSVLALEIDELLHRCGGDAFGPRAAFPPEPTSFFPDALQPQTIHSS